MPERTICQKKKNANQIALYIYIAKTYNDEEIENFYTSSVICRTTCQDKIDEINEILQYLASTRNFHFIDYNSNIKPNHLSGNVHLIEEEVLLSLLIIIYTN